MNSVKLANATFIYMAPRGRAVVRTLASAQAQICSYLRGTTALSTLPESEHRVAGDVLTEIHV
jgi:hypothetical protein